MTGLTVRLDASAAALLDAAASRIEEHGWLQGGWYLTASNPFTSPCCASAAIVLSAGIDPYDRQGAKPRSVTTARHFLRKSIDSYMIDIWNDRPERTKDEVVAALREAGGSGRSCHPGTSTHGRTGRVTETAADEDREAIWLGLRDAVRDGNPDVFERHCGDLLGGAPVTITYTGTDAGGTERAETIDVADPKGWIRRRHDQGWTTLTVTRDATEIGGITHDPGTGESTVWFEGGEQP